MENKAITIQVLKDALEKVNSDSFSHWLPNRPQVFHNEFLPPGAIYLNNDTFRHTLAPPPRLRDEEVFRLDGPGALPAKTYNLPDTAGEPWP